MADNVKSDKKGKIDFSAKWRIYVLIPAVIFVTAILIAVIFNVEVAIEFRGGTMLSYSYENEINTGDVEGFVNGLDKGNVGVTTGSSFGSDLQTLTLSFASNQGLKADVQSEISSALIERFSENNLVLVNSQDVNPSTGGMFFLKCLVAVIFSFIVLIIYIAFRFKKIGGWSAGAFALTALMCDVFMVMASFVFFRLEINANFMAVVLTVLGYSINNTIVIYDRIRENRNLYGKKMSHRELVNTSIRQSLTRSINTTITTGLAILVVCIVSLVFGVNSIVSFAFPMLVGLISGVYSSLLLAGPLWVAWQEHKIKKGSPSKA